MSEPTDQKPTKAKKEDRHSGLTSKEIETAIFGTMDNYRGKVTKADGETVQSRAYEVEDEYRDFYIGAAHDKGIIEPPYNLRSLDRLSQENNALSPCIEAMVTNVDGTGYDFNAKDDTAEDDKDDTNIEALTDFFSQPWPGLSFQTMRKTLRRELESLGNAYLEVIRNPKGDILYLRTVDAKMMRLIRLDEPVEVTKKIMRGGKEVATKIMMRERRFCQQLNGRTMVYFKEFGASRDLDKDTGTWAPVGQRLPANKRATEIIHFTLLPDSFTPYGVPRWISQLPSVLGSRQAEEFNMDFFDNGGVPPAIIFLQGGTMGKDTANALEQKVSRGAAAAKSNIKVVEVEPSGGSMERESTARVTVERFGAERQSDAMFENYDDKCEERVRRAFRLPPIFVGKASDYSFATAFASYTVAEAQVFKPERDEFDEIMSLTILNDMGFSDYMMVSNPLVIEDTTIKLQGIELGLSTGAVEMGDVLYEINEAAGTNLKLKEGYDPDNHNQQGTLTVDANGNMVPANQNQPQGGLIQSGTTVQPKAPAPTPVAKGERSITDLALDAITAARKNDPVKLSEIVQIVHKLDAVGYNAFKEATARITFMDNAADGEGLATLAACAQSVIGGWTNTHQ